MPFPRKSEAEERGQFSSERDVSLKRRREANSPDPGPRQTCPEDEEAEDARGEGEEADSSAPLPPKRARHLHQPCRRDREGAAFWAP